MMPSDRGTDTLFYLGTGPILAIVLGAILIPLRDMTPASNLTFPFLALTILVAEWGGRSPAVATALTSAMSLDFFLTRPYLHLTIAEKHDVVAFIGLAFCGLIAAAFGSRRTRGEADLSRTRRHFDLLHAAIRGMDEAASPRAGLAAILEILESELPVAAAAVRDEHGDVVAAVGGAERRAAPARSIRPDAIPTTPAFEDGLRYELYDGGRRIGALDVWSGPAPIGAEGWRSLGDVARVAGVVLGRAGRGRGAPATPVS